MPAVRAFWSSHTVAVAPIICGHLASKSQVFVLTELAKVRATIYDSARSAKYMQAQAHLLTVLQPGGAVLCDDAADAVGQLHFNVAFAANGQLLSEQLSIFFTSIIGP